MIYRPLWHKLYGLAEPFLAYDGFADALAGGIVLAGRLLAWRHRRLRAAPGIALALAVLFVAYLVCPFEMKQTGFIDARFPIMLGLLLFAGLRPGALSSRVRIAIAAVLALAFVARTASLADVWFDHNRDLADFRQVIAAVEPGSRVLVVSVDPQDAPAYWATIARGRRDPGLRPYRLPSPRAAHDRTPGILAVPFRGAGQTAAGRAATLRPPFGARGAAAGLAVARAGLRRESGWACALSHELAAKL